MMSLAGSPPTLSPMVSPERQESEIGFCSAKGDKIRRTAANREQGNPQAGGAETPERHVFGVESDESIIVSVVGSHCCRREEEE